MTMTYSKKLGFQSKEDLERSREKAYRKRQKGNFEGKRKFIKLHSLEDLKTLYENNPVQNQLQEDNPGGA